MLRKLVWVRTEMMCGWEGTLHLPWNGCENVNTAARPPLCDHLQGKGAELLLGLMDCVFIWASLFALRGFFPFAFQVLWWFPHPWQQQDTSIDPCPAQNSPAGRENTAQPLCLGGERQREKGVVPWLEFLIAQKGFQAGRGSGAQDRSLFPQWAWIRRVFTASPG